MANPTRFQTICVIGLGYIGLPTAAAFAQRKVRVIGVDIDAETVATINRGEIHIIEPDLEDAVYKAVKEGFFEASTTPAQADAFLIAVPTPLTSDDRQPDLSYIRSAAQMIAPVLKAGDLIVLESTVPVGTTEQMAQWLAETRSDLSFPHQQSEQSDIRIAHCPERVMPGKVMRELVSNDRVIGGMTGRCAKEAASLYRLFVQGECITTNVRTAEMCKLAENAFRDVNIAYANEISLICDRFGIDVWELIRFANRHPRVNILQPGPGVGGHCIAVDPWFIISGAIEESKLIRAAREVNDSKPEWVVEQVQKAAEEFRLNHSRNPVIAALGLSFKADIDDLRESPAVKIAQTLMTDSGAELNVVEPHITLLPKSLSACRLADLSSAINAADIVLILVKHRIFKEFFATNKLSADVKVINAAGLEIPNRS